MQFTFCQINARKDLFVKPFLKYNICTLMSMGLQVFKEYADFCAEYGDVSVIPTHAFLAPMVPGQRINVDLEKGKHLLVKFLSQSAELDENGKRAVSMIGI